MPRKPKISPSQRRDWLERHERGERQDEIAKNDKVNPRTVREQLERARLELAFDLAQQEQLREALASHQKDMLDLLKRIKSAVEAPMPAYFTPSPDYGLEDLRPPQLARQEEAGLRVSEAVNVLRDGDGPRAIRLIEEDSRLWHALKEHLGVKAPIWHSITDWRRALLEELQARAQLNRAIREKAQQNFNLPIQSDSTHPYLTPAIVPFIRTEITKRAPGEPATNLADSVTRVDGILHHQGHPLAENLVDTDRALDNLTATLRAMSGAPEAQAAAQAHRKLEDSSKKACDELEDYLLLHHIPGRCGLCRKLGGQ